MNDEGNNKFILMGLGDENSKEIAEVLRNKTSKKIVDFLADRKEASEKDIADGLGMAMNTVEYNLKKLIKVGLVEKSKTFFWSVKGKKIPMYKMANKHIIISPNKKPSIDSLKAILPFVAIIAVIAIVIGIFSFNGNELNAMGRDQQAIDGLSKFSSYEDMQNFLESQNSENYEYYGGVARTFTQGSENFAVSEDAAAPSAVPGVAASSAGGADGKSTSVAGDYSQTNIQVEGVDEPDIVKNDDKYIYVAQGKKVVIVDAYPAEEMNILDELDMNENVMNLFVNGDKLIVFTNDYQYIDTGVQCGGVLDLGIRCGGYGKSSTVVYVYNIADRENAELENKYEFDGDYVEARMKGDFVYLISSKYIDMNFIDMPYYSVNGEETKIAATDVYYFHSPDDNYVFNTVSAIDLDSGDMNSETYLLGYSTGLYVSENNIYLAYQKRLSQEYTFEKFASDVVLETLPPSESSKVEEIMDSDENLRIKSREVGEVFRDYIDELDGQEKIDFLKDYSKKSEEFYNELAKEQEKTIIHKISYDNDKLGYEGSGEVAGRISNQFSMDEFDGNFRIATTTGGWDRDKNENHIFVLNEDLETIGSVEGLAKGEQIYSARFMGDKAYLVTFRQTDPLFVIDLSDPTNPAVLGELKVTGYSGYLHPYDENHLLGIGMEATESGRTQGVKISLFDVSDYENPKEISKYEIDDGQWSSSDAIYDHKAVLFDKDKELLVIPVSYSKPVTVPGQSYPNYEYWQGVYVFNVNLEDGIDLKGKIEHDVENKDQEYYENNAYVRRSLFMDNVLYTISDKYVKANGLEDLGQIKKVKLPEIEYRLYGGYGGDISVDSVKVSEGAAPAMTK